MVPDLVLVFSTFWVPIETFNFFFSLFYIFHRNWTSDKMLEFNGFVSRTHKHSSSKPTVFGFAGNFMPSHNMHFFFKKNRRSLLWVMLFCIYVF